MERLKHDAAIAALRNLLDERLSTGSSILTMHSRDEAYTKPVLPDAVAFPETAEEVSQIVKICGEHGCPVIPFRIGTSLEGHVVPIHGGVSVDTSRLNRIMHVNAEDLDAVVQPGVTRNQLNDELRATGLMFTVDPGADASLGGMAATRASGTNAVRYGTMADNVKALEVVLADGRHGSEAWAAEQATSFGEIAKQFGGGEFTWASRTEDRARIWKARHEAYYASKALRPGATGVVTDCCVPISALAECMGRAQEEIAKLGLIAPIVGHVGDGNFHLLILVEPGNAAELKQATKLAETISLLALELGGTVTGEHGVGIGKRKFMAAEHGEAYAVMKEVKRSLDPRNILNPGKLGN